MTSHIITAVGLLGVDATVLALSIAGARGATPAAVYPAAQLIGAWLLLPLATLSLVTGVLLGLLTPWGLLRHWWVTIKLVLNAAGLVLALLVLTPALGTAAHVATAVTGPQLATADRLGLVRDTAAASTVLTVSVLLAVYKPFGRRGDRRRPAVSSARGAA